MRIGTEGLVAKGRLEDDDIAQLEALQNVCETADGYRIKLNWDAIGDRDPNLLNDFCFYDAGRLVGYASLDDYEPAREATSAVHPAYRGRGIYRQLFAAFRDEAIRRDGGPLLLVAYRSSSRTPPRPTRSGTPYRISEYRMEAILESAPPSVQTAFTLEDVTAANVAELSRGLAIAFGADHSRPPERLLRDLRDPNVRYWLAVLDGIVIGQIGTVREDDDVYIRAVGIYPDYRRRGYGRQLLASVVARMYEDGCHRFSLDVETENAGALSIYTSCGFSEKVIYDYYTVL